MRWNELQRIQKEPRVFPEIIKSYLGEISVDVKLCSYDCCRVDAPQCINVTHASVPSVRSFHLCANLDDLKLTW